MFNSLHCLQQIETVKLADLPQEVKTIYTDSAFMLSDKKLIKKNLLAVEQAVRITLLNKYRASSDFKVKKPLVELKHADVYPEYTALAAKLGL